MSNAGRSHANHFVNLIRQAIDTEVEVHYYYSKEKLTLIKKKKRPQHHRFKLIKAYSWDAYFCSDLEKRKHT